MTLTLIMESTIQPEFKKDIILHIEDAGPVRKNISSLIVNHPSIIEEYGQTLKIIESTVLEELSEEGLNRR